MCTGSLRALGLSHGASHVEIKAAFRALAKEWHPDRHHGIAKKNAEERFKQIQSAYQSLSTNYDPRMPPMNGPPTDGMGFPGRRYGTPSYNRRADEWGPNPAAKNPFKSYMDFSHPEVANARQRVQQGKKQRTLICAGVFGVGMLLVVLSANRDHRKRKSGDLIDAYYNQARPSMLACRALRSHTHRCAPHALTHYALAPLHTLALARAHALVLSCTLYAHTHTCSNRHDSVL